MARIFIVTVLVILINSCAEDTGIDITKTYLNPCDYIIEDFSEINISNSNYFGTDSTLDVITWNLEQFPKHNSTVDYLLELIPILNVDIIALQEIGSTSDFQNLINNLNNYDGIITNSASYNINLAFLYSNNLEVEATYEIFTDNWWSFPRSPLVAHIIWNEKNIYIINNHFKAMGGTENEDRRKSASEKLEDYVNEYLSVENVIILGDLNDELNEDPSNNVFQNFINDALNFQFTDMDIAYSSSSNWSYPSWPSHLDHILITNELFDEFDNEGSSVQTIRLEEYFDNGWIDYEKYISDHRPVGLSLKFNP